MLNHCIALLAYAEKNRFIEHSIYSLADECGIPYTSMWMILDEAYKCKTDSLLMRVAMTYGYDFKVYRGYNSSTNQYTKGIIIDVVKTDWKAIIYPES